MTTSRPHHLGQQGQVHGLDHKARSFQISFPATLVKHSPQSTGLLAHLAPPSPTERSPGSLGGMSPPGELAGKVPKLGGFGSCVGTKGLELQVPPSNTSVNHSSAQVDGLGSSSGRGLSKSHKASGLLPGQFGDMPRPSSVCVWH